MTRVIKLGGRAQGDPRLPALVASAVSQDQLCVVHGGGDEVTALMRQLGREPTFVQGRRVTTLADLDLVRMVLSGTVNKRLVSQFLNAGIRAVGISGEDGALLQATLFNGGSLGAVGAPALVNAGLLEALMDAGYLPVISPLGRGPDGNALNVNGDDAAASIAAAIDASELLLVADVPGVLDASGDLIKVLHTDAAEQLISTGIAKGGMAAKLDAATRGLLHGVARVRIGNMDAIEDTTAGTSVFLTPSVV